MHCCACPICYGFVEQPAAVCNKSATNRTSGVGTLCIDYGRSSAMCRSQMQAVLADLIPFGLPGLTGPFIVVSWLIRTISVTVYACGDQIASISWGYNFLLQSSLSEKFTRLRNELLDGKFSASTNSGTRCGIGLGLITCVNRIRPLVIFYNIMQKKPFTMFTNK